MPVDEDVSNLLLSGRWQASSYLTYERSSIENLLSVGFDRLVGFILPDVSV